MDLEREGNNIMDFEEKIEVRMRTFMNKLEEAEEKIEGEREKRRKYEEREEKKK